MLWGLRVVYVDIAAAAVAVAGTGPGQERPMMAILRRLPISVRFI